MLFIINNNISYAIDKKVKAELIPHCGMTKGGVATATPDGKIYYCPQRIANIDWNFPGAVDFFILHEYGHIVLQSGNELEVDCWTAYEFSLMKDKKSKKSIKEALKFIRGFIPNLGSIDISPVVLILGLIFLRNFINEIFYKAAF